MASSSLPATTEAPKLKLPNDEAADEELERTVAGSAVNNEHEADDKVLLLLLVDKALKLSPNVDKLYPKRICFGRIVESQLGADC